MYMRGFFVSSINELRSDDYFVGFFAALTAPLLTTSWVVTF
jgi:hypothetical protein